MGTENAIIDAKAVLSRQSTSPKRQKNISLGERRLTTSVAASDIELIRKEAHKGQEKVRRIQTNNHEV
jgi:hypothetical protein